MTTVFADTSFFIALLHARDPFHKTAAREQRALAKTRRPFVTTDAVLLELGDAFASHSRWLVLASFLAGLKNDPRGELVMLTREMLDEALALRSSRLDKDWGLTDCTSFVVMKRLGLRDALTSDRHFTQAGFNALLRAKADA